MLTIQTYGGKSKINSAKQLPPLGIEPWTLGFLLWHISCLPHWVNLASVKGEGNTLPKSSIFGKNWMPSFQIPDKNYKYARNNLRVKPEFYAVIPLSYPTTVKTCPSSFPHFIVATLKTLVSHSRREPEWGDRLWGMGGHVETKRGHRHF